MSERTARIKTGIAPATLSSLSLLIPYFAYHLEHETAAKLEIKTAKTNRNFFLSIIFYPMNCSNQIGMKGYPVQPRYVNGKVRSQRAVYVGLTKVKPLEWMTTQFFFQAPGVALGGLGNDLAPFRARRFS